MPAARVLLDIPEGGPARGEEASLTMERLESMLRDLEEPPEPPPPPIATVARIDSILALLPSDRAGNVDWAAAWREGTIDPRPGVPGTVNDEGGAFRFDLYLQSGDGPEAFFPHSTHQEWVGCQSCHPRIYRDGTAGPSDAQTVHETASCSTCHGPVAFPMQTCERCHETATNLPAGRARKVLGETLRMRRELPDGPSLDGYGLYEPAVFPHGLHRLRFQCRACHDKPFAMESGSTSLTAQEAHSRRACGACHNGEVAFDAQLDTCYRCHEDAVADR
jgi:c(7)-type cytochrome triheme protein